MKKKGKIGIKTSTKLHQIEMEGSSGGSEGRRNPLTHSHRRRSPLTMDVGNVGEIMGFYLTHVFWTQPVQEMIVIRLIEGLAFSPYSMCQFEGAFNRDLPSSLIRHRVYSSSDLFGHFSRNQSLSSNEIAGTNLGFSKKDLSHPQFKRRSE